MNEQNFDYLKNQLKYTGFGEEMQKDLRAQLGAPTLQPNFTLSHKAEFGSDKVDVTLHFRKSEQTDLYFFNRYELALTKANQEQGLKQSFNVGRENNITLKEGYNLLQGRAIHKELTPKEGEKFQAWLQLNFKETDPNGNFKMKQFHQNYGFDLQQSLSKFQIAEMVGGDSQQSLIRSLERGNRQSVTMSHEGKEQKMFVEANPQFKSINVYDGNFKKVIIQSQKEKQVEGQAQSLSEKQIPRETKKEVSKEKAGKDEDGAAGKKTQRQSSKQKQSLT